MEEKDVAHQTVARFAPNELPLFDALWSDASRHSPEILLGDQLHGCDASIPSITLVSTFLIPIVVSVCSQVVVKTAESILAHIRRHHAALPPSVSAEDLARSLAAILDRSLPPARD